MKPETKSRVVVGFLTLFALFAFIRATGPITYTLPLFIFYAILLVSTYYSIRLFAGITPTHLKFQNFIDGVLVILYILLALNFSEPIAFAYLLVIYFGTTLLKYLQLLNIVNQPKLLKRKNTANTLGVLMSVFTLGGMLEGYILASSWFLACVFTLAHVYILFISPLYVVDSETK